MRRILAVLFCLLACSCQKQESSEMAKKSEPALPASGPAWREMQMVKGRNPPFSTSAQRFRWAAAAYLDRQELQVEKNPIVRLHIAKVIERVNVGSHVHVGKGRTFGKTGCPGGIEDQRRVIRFGRDPVVFRVGLSKRLAVTTFTIVACNQLQLN